MSLVKIEHADPHSSQPIAFDVVRAVPKDAPDAHSETSDDAPVRAEGTDQPRDKPLTVDEKHALRGIRPDRYPNEEVMETVVIRPGHFHLMSLSGFALREVGMAEVNERERIVRERIEQDAEIAREVKAKQVEEQRERDEKAYQERKAAVEKASGVKPDRHPDETSEQEAEAERERNATNQQQMSAANERYMNPAPQENHQPA